VNVVSITIAAFLIFGPPQLGVLGAALAAAIARTLGAIFLLGGMFQSGALRGARWRLEFTLIKRILGIGLPALGEQLILNFGLLGYGLIALQLGTTLFAAQRVALTLIGLAWMPAFGYGAAITALVGQAIGAGDTALTRALARVGSVRAMVWMTGLAIVCFALADPLVGLFTVDLAVRDAAANGLRVLCLGQPFWGLGQVYAGALRGVGDTRFPMISTTIGVWIVRLPVAWFFCLWLGLGLPGLFISNSVDAALRALLVTVRFLRSRWHERILARTSA
jgi:putative MATE family efflux protein